MGFSRKRGGAGHSQDRIAPPSPQHFRRPSPSFVVLVLAAGDTEEARSYFIPAQLKILISCHTFYTGIYQIFDEKTS